jgi:hypothetical protein
MGNEGLKQTPASGGSLLNDGLGTAVLVDGDIVAWFSEFTEEARDWCSENYFGRWLTWRSKPPEIVPLTHEELKQAEAKAAELAEFFKCDDGEEVIYIDA